MYRRPGREDFSHIEGYEDHSVNLLYTWDRKGRLTGVVINIAAPAQVSEGSYMITADYWHDTRQELAKRLGEDVYILPQSSSVGDQSPHIMVDWKAEERMQQLMFPDVEAGRGSLGRRKQIAVRIADAVTSVLPYVKDRIDWDPLFAHRMEIVNFSRRFLSIDDVNEAMEESGKAQKQYEKLLMELKENPGIREKHRWYVDIARAYGRTMTGPALREQYELQRVEPKFSTEIHVIRLGDIVIATNPFELYLDFGIRIKGRSPALQTFLVQHAGSGSYLPTSRSVAGGAYGAIPRSNLVGPEGGRELVESTLELINAVWEE